MKLWTAYKIVYLAAVALNIVYLGRQSPEGYLARETLEPFPIASSVLVCNLASSTCAVLGYRWAFSTEIALSAGRIVIIALAASVFAGGLVLYSPTFFSLWGHLFEASKDSLGYLWAGCGVLLSVEFAFVRAMSRNLRGQ